MVNSKSSVKGQTEPANDFASELDEPRWSVISFEKLEKGGMTYREAIDNMSELYAAGVFGLCIVTDEAAAMAGQKQATA